MIAVMPVLKTYVYVLEIKFRLKVILLLESSMALTLLVSLQTSYKHVGVHRTVLMICGLNVTCTNVCV